jgi:hypothetical protein
MDKAGAIDRFLGRVDQFSQIALVTDGELAHLFGEEVAQALAQLEHYAAENRICADCGGVCCKDIGCELYSAQFSRCPIHEYRPIACRMHFCRRLDDPYRSVIVELRDVFVGCYGAMDFWPGASLRSLDSPPFGEVCPRFVAAVAPWINAVRQGRLASGPAGRSLGREAAEYRRCRAGGRLDSEYSGAATDQAGQDWETGPKSAGQSSSAGTSTLTRDLFR